MGNLPNKPDSGEQESENENTTSRVENKDPQEPGMQRRTTAKSEV
jgi:hypothetical protein